MKTLNSSFVVTSLLALSTVLAGCGSYRVVERTPNGGEVALQGSPDKAREAADGYMASQCPGGFDVVEEHEAVIGSQTNAQTTRGRTFGIPTQNTTETTTDKREWRIKYQCKGTATAGAPGKQGKIQELTVRY